MYEKPVLVNLAEPMDDCAICNTGGHAELAE